MTDDSFHSVLRRKAGAGRARLRIATLTPEKALVQALAKTAQDRMNLPLKVEENAAALLSLAELPEHLPDRALMSLLSGPKDALGILSLDPDLMAGLMEMQMTGRLGLTPVEPRRPTRTDAVMCSPFIDHFLRQLQAELGGTDAGGNWAAGYAYASALDDPRTLGLLLEDQPYRCFRLTVELGIGATRTGSLFLALPGTDAVDAGGVNADAEAAETAHWQEALSQSVMEAPAALGTVLHRLVLPLAQAVALAPGAELTLPRDALDRVELTDASGRILARARLGQASGHRAVCLATSAASAAEEGGAEGQHGEVAAPLLAGSRPTQVPGADGADGGDRGDTAAGDRSLAVGF